ncbi:putative MFS family arabinose efflux permease [Pontibacter ummariensis]|uniref:Predicted arabinose efflux permease, MFS family n=1 Tax=Pontibacter ummariensis TaxID=1610492 RepID=A0A239E356_9BACT|nr:MFS transporter [Pontibacter ummariensis]PRY13647.1 putative MFS family arabinose efflux permease [Pontibacter ummariensis]SNS38423.1 Predicted arabinose efflux permease, MFS family [Pontibacter ummariensis]
MAEKIKEVYGVQFGLLCLSSFLFFASFNMIIPELPDYLSSLGGEEYKGLIISLFTLTAGLSRPFSGKLADQVGRIPVMIFGVGVCIVAGFLYPLTGTVAAFLFLRFLHGFSTGFTPTGKAAYVADVVPVARRGEAMGLLGLSGSLGMAAGPAIGGAIANQWSVDAMFYASSLMAFLSIAVIWNMQETLDDPNRFQVGLLKISREELFEPRVLAPSLVMLFTSFAFGTILTIIPDFSEHLGIENKGLFFTSFTLSSLAIRFLAGKASDRYGRVNVLRVSTFLLTVAMFVIGSVSSATALLLSGVLFGVAVGMNSPTIYAWTIDLSHEARRGRAMATMYIALEAGIGIGALSSGWLYANEADNFSLVFWTAGVFSLLAFLYLVLQVRHSAQSVLD